MPGQIQNLAPTDVHAALGTRPQGLNTDEVNQRLAEIGANTLEATRKLWWLASLGRQFSNFFTILLGISAAICFVAEFVQPGESMDILGWALAGVAVLNALFSFAQEYRAERAMEALRKYLPQMVLAVRDGDENNVAVTSLVPGDVIQLREGDRIPADARVVDADGLLVDNAPLTGEANPINIDAAATEALLTEARNLVFAGCSVLRGTAHAVVFATGFRSQFGRIAMLSREIRRKPSPLERETRHMVRVLTIIAVAMGLTFFAYGVFSGRSWWVNLVFMMGIIVANVPEGLLPTFTLSLAMGSLRMARRNVLVKSLNAVEALGAVHVICTDKTGTLTQNRLSVVRVAAPQSVEAIDDVDRQRRILETALATADLTATPEGLSGDPLDIAVAENLAAQGVETSGVLTRTRDLFPFDVEKRRAAAIATDKDGHAFFAVKGAWEALRPMIDAPETQRSIADDVVAALAGEAYRVIAVARGRPDSATADDRDQTSHEHDLELLGFLCLEDPLRPEVPDAVADCHRAGIGMVMITGDHPLTAEAIARRAGMVAGDMAPGTCVITGSELEAMREGDVARRLTEGATVFARTTPEQKMKIVAALHHMHKVVAVTGDGVNDAPALKAADVGIAMGRSGTDVAREAAQVILLDDNFASIVAGIEEGRTIYANIRKFTNYVLVSNGPEIMPYLLYMLLPVPLALTVIQILSIDLGTDIIPSMALGQEKPDPEVMRAPPRDRGQGLLTLPMIAHSYLFLGLIEAAVSLGLFFWVLFDGGWQWGAPLATDAALYHSATGIALASILLMQIGNLFGRRSATGLGIDRAAFRNPLLIFGIVFEAVASWAILYVPAVGTVLGTGPVAAEVYAVACASPLLIFGLDYARKRVAARMRLRPGDG